MAVYFETHVDSSGMSSTQLPMEYADKTIRFYIPNAMEEAAASVGASNGQNRRTKKSRKEILEILERTHGIFDETFQRQPQIVFDPPPSFE